MWRLLALPLTSSFYFCISHRPTPLFRKISGFDTLSRFTMGFFLLNPWVAVKKTFCAFIYLIQVISRTLAKSQNSF